MRCIRRVVNLNNDTIVYVNRQCFKGQTVLSSLHYFNFLHNALFQILIYCLGELFFKSFKELFLRNLMSF